MSAAFKKFLEAVKKAAFDIKAKPGLPALKESLTNIANSLKGPVGSVKSLIPANVTKSISGLINTVKVKVGGIMGKKGSGSAASAGSPGSPASGGGQLQLDKIKKTLMGILNKDKIKKSVEDLTKNLKMDTVKKSVEDLSKKVNIGDIKKKIQGITSKVQEKMPKKGGEKPPKKS